MRLQFWFVLLMVIGWQGSVSAGFDCTAYHTVWDADGVYTLTGNTDNDRRANLVEVIACANSYSGNGTPTARLDADLTTYLSSAQTYAGTGGNNAFPPLSGTLLLDGGGFTLSRDASAGADDYRFFQVNSTGDLTLRNITLSGGDLSSFYGGAAYYEGMLTLEDATIVGNLAGQGGGLYGNGTLTVRRSRIIMNTATSNAGGGIYNLGDSLTITDSILNLNTGNALYNTGGKGALVSSTVADNNSFQAAGIRNGGTLTVVNSQIISNNADPDNSNGGGINNNGSGVLTLVNTVVRDNRAAIGGGLYNGATARAINSTFANNINKPDFTGSNIRSPGPLTLTNTLITDGVNNTDVDAGNITFQGHNFVSDGSVTGANVLTGDPLLDANLVPLRGSPAVNAGDTSFLPTDAYDVDSDGDTSEVLPLDTDGTQRVRGSAVDLGAQEAYLDLLEDGLFTPVDAVFVVNRIGQPITGDNSAADVDADGDIDAADVDEAVARLGTTAP